MAYYNSNKNRFNNSWYGKGKNYKSKRKSKYTNAENIAFRLGQEQRVKRSINSGKKDSRVYEAFCKGLNGLSNNGKKKSLFGD